MREHVLTVDGSDLSWEASAGELFVELCPYTNDVTRWVWTPPTLAALALATLTSEGQSGVRELALIAELTRYVQYTDALDAEAG